MSEKKEHEHNVAGSQFNLYNKSLVGLNFIMAFECLRQYFVTKALPDLNDAIESFPGWKRAFGEALYGLIFLIILVKQPTPRRLILTSFRKNLQMKCISERMYNAYVDAIWTVAEDPESFLAEIDAMKGPSHAHGFLRLAMRLGILEKEAANATKFDVSLGASGNKYTVKPYCKQIGLQIEKFVKLSSFVAERGPACNLKLYNQGYDEFCKQCVAHAIPLMSMRAKRQYNKEWSFRQFEVGSMRANKIRRLGVTKKSMITDLPGPESKRFFSRLAKHTKLQYASDLWDEGWVTIPAEFVCAAGCLSEGKFKQNKSHSSAAGNARSLAGPCAVCFAGHRTAHHCRVVLRHTLVSRERHRRGRPEKKVLCAYGAQTKAKLANMKQPRLGRCEKCAARHLSAKVCRIVLKHK